LVEVAPSLSKTDKFVNVAVIIHFRFISSHDFSSPRFFW
jgi:hypothetical protein